MLETIGSRRGRLHLQSALYHEKGRAHYGAHPAGNSARRQAARKICEAFAAVIVEEALERWIASKPRAVHKDLNVCVCIYG